MPEQQISRQTRILAVANQKGGVGKTTSTINLAAGLAEIGARVAIVDLDPQGNASTGLGIDANSRKLSSYDLLLEEASPLLVFQEVKAGRLWICPATADLSSTDMELVSNERRSFLLRDALRQPAIAKFGFDFILIDCPPSLNLLTVNAMVAADAVLVPLQAEFFALEGLSQLMLTLREVRQTANPDLRIEGVLLTMYDTRNNLSLQVEQDARETLGDLVFPIVIPRNVRLSEAPSFAQSVLEYDPTSKGAEAYRALARIIAARQGLQLENEGVAR